MPLNATSTLAAINALPPGAITHATVILNTSQVPELIKLSRGASKHVEFVGHRELIDLLYQKCKTNFSAACPLT
jgi:hypothetical protein